MPILDTLDIISKTFQWWFWGKTYLLGARLRVMEQKLKNTCWWWLWPKCHSVTDMAEQVIVEQFVHILLPQGRAWVLQHRTGWWWV